MMECHKGVWRFPWDILHDFLSSASWNSFPSIKKTVFFYPVENTEYRSTLFSSVDATAYRTVFFSPVDTKEHRTFFRSPVDTEGLWN